MDCEAGLKDSAREGQSTTAKEQRSPKSERQGGHIAWEPEHIVFPPRHWTYWHKGKKTRKEPECARSMVQRSRQGEHKNAERNHDDGKLGTTKSNPGDGNRPRHTDWEIGLKSHAET